MNPARELYKRIRDNKELQEFELKGFLKGLAKGKTMNVDINRIMFSVNKQHVDLEKAYRNFILGKPNGEYELKQAIADLRDVAGCAFIKLLDELKAAKKHDKETIEGLGSLFNGA